MKTSCVLMFSGGRDSTISAIRLANIGKGLLLTTISSEYLVGIPAVEQRVRELKRYLPKETLWIIFDDSRFTAPALSLGPNICLNCFLKYTSLGVIMARKFNAPSIAFGFTKYQSDWPEQTSYAVDELKKVLSELSIRLLLPVYNITKKEEVIEELRVLGLTTSALEQKCSRQERTVVIPSSFLESTIDQWTAALRLTISSNLDLNINPISILRLDDIKP